LTLHRSIIDQWSKVLVNYKKGEKDHRLLLCQILIKMADISNPGKPFPLAKRWARLVQEEFFLQGDKEKQHNVPVSLYMDRNNPCLSKMQIGFLDFFVFPLSEKVVQLFPKLQFMNDNLIENKENWKQYQETETQSEKKS
jgi:hypothetical protein